MGLFEHLTDPGVGTLYRCICQGSNRGITQDELLLLLCIIEQSSHQLTATKCLRALYSVMHDPELQNLLVPKQLHERCTKAVLRYLFRWGPTSLDLFVKAIKSLRDLNFNESSLKHALLSPLADTLHSCLDYLHNEDDSVLHFFESCLMIDARQEAFLSCGGARTFVAIANYQNFSAISQAVHIIQRAAESSVLIKRSADLELAIMFLEKVARKCHLARYDKATEQLEKDVKQLLRLCAPSKHDRAKSPAARVSKQVFKIPSQKGEAPTEPVVIVPIIVEEYKKPAAFIEFVEPEKVDIDHLAPLLDKFNSTDMHIRAEAVRIIRKLSARQAELVQSRPKDREAISNGLKFICRMFSERSLEVRQILFKCNVLPETSLDITYEYIQDDEKYINTLSYLVRSDKSEISLIIGMLCYTNELLEVEKILQNVLNMPVQLSREKLLVLRQLFTDNLFDELTIAKKAIALSPYSLLKSGTFQRMKVDIKPWMQDLMKGMKLPIHSLVLPLLKLYAERTKVLPSSVRLQILREKVGRQSPSTASDSKELTPTELTSYFQKCISNPDITYASLEYLLSLQPIELQQYSDPIYSDLLPSLLHPNTQKRILKAFTKVFQYINVITPREVWLRTINCWRCDEDKTKTYWTHQDIVVNPLTLFRCHDRVFKCAELFSIFLQILDCLSSRVKDANLYALLDLQETSIMQALLEICREQYQEKEGVPSNKIDRYEVRQAICFFLHQRFIGSINYLKMLHFQGYPEELLPLTVSSIASMHVCFDFIPELLAQPQLSKQLFGIKLAALLCEKYPLPNSMKLAKEVLMPKIYNMCKTNTQGIILAGDAMDTQPPRLDSTVVQQVLPLIVNLGRAFPSFVDLLKVLLTDSVTASGLANDAEIGSIVGLIIEKLNEIQANPQAYIKSRQGKNENESDKRELVFKEDGQEYASVVKMVGNGWVEVTCMDGEKRSAHIRGAFRKKVWITVGDLVLLGLRDYQDGKADIILKYTADEARLLKSYGELPDNVRINETDMMGSSDEEVNVEFDIDDI
ncbi:Translation initiation factor 1A [Chytridiales sp. JEL 0842]|nr:Translation initiation factor 1A [Chytridiales sp. JEL 0842]